MHAHDASTESPLRILFAASEALPLIKTGGLADVAGSLPAALAALGQDVRLVLPAFPRALHAAGELETLTTLEVPGAGEPVHILGGRMPGNGVPLYLVSAHGHFDRGGNPYTDLTGRDWGDNADRFTLFGRVLALMAMDRAGLGWAPDLFHGNDWQTGLAPVLLHDAPGRPATLFTIHNLSYQGLYDRATFDRLGLPRDLWRPDGLEFHGGFSFIKGGIGFSDRVNTVSPTYAKEVLTPHLGYGLDGLLRHLGERFSGILNGIDYDYWNPATDPALHHHYDADEPGPKVEAKLDLQREFGLPEDPDAFLFAHIGRLVPQKGVDLILGILPRLLERPGVQLVVQGTGDPALQRALAEAHAAHPGRIGLYLGYDEPRAHRIEAGSDAFLMPSRFEPCGLNQMYSLRYGSVPVVHRTGGLADTVVDATPDNLETARATGFLFEHTDIEGLWYAIRQALALRANDPDGWRRLMVTGMRQDFSWQASARRYLELYRTAVGDLRRDGS